MDMINDEICICDTPLNVVLTALERGKGSHPFLANSLPAITNDERMAEQLKAAVEAENTDEIRALAFELTGYVNGMSAMLKFVRGNVSHALISYVTLIGKALFELTQLTPCNEEQEFVMPVIYPKADQPAFRAIFWEGDAPANAEIFANWAHDVLAKAQ